MTVLAIASQSSAESVDALLTKLTLSAGAQLAQLTLPETGRYWLRSGKVTGNRPPSPGDSWGYSAAQAACETNHEIDGSWVAQTDLVIYHLPMSCFNHR